MTIFIIVASIVVGGGVGFGLMAALSRKRIRSAESLSSRIVEEAKKEADTLKKEGVLQARETLVKAKAESEREGKERRQELDAMERKIRAREEHVDKRSDALAQKESQIEGREKSLVSKEGQIQEKTDRLSRMIEEERQKLERVAGISSEEAKEQLVQAMESEAKRDAALLIRKVEEEAKRNAEKASREVMVYAMQRYASDFVAESTVSVVNLPSDEMKGRIIGREGRNIRAIEAATGIDLMSMTPRKRLSCRASTRSAARWPAFPWSG
jgi:ribonuclease Y